MLNQTQKSSLEKQAKYVLKLSGEMKDKVIQEYLNDLAKVIKQEIKKSEIAVYVMKVN